MVLPGPLVVPRHDQAIRVGAASIVFSGVGLGPVVSGLLVPVLIAGLGVVVVFGDAVLPLVFRGVEGAWLGLGALCLALTAGAWRQWPAELPAAPDEATVQASGRTVWLILVAHGLNAVGYLAHTMFWVDYLVRDMGMTLASGGFYWSVFGFGAAVGPLLAGRLARTFGIKHCLLAGFALKALAAALPVWASSAPALFASSLVMGICTPGVVALVAAYTLETVGPALNRTVWGKATFSFSLAQGAGGFLMALAVSHLDSYRPLFLVSAMALLGAIACLAAVRKHQAPRMSDEVEEMAANDIVHPSGGTPGG
jgi:predicted MFS family arabinose efflux permease